MREIKFRGQRKGDKQWVYGFIVTKRNEVNPDEFKHFDEYLIYDKNEECYFKVIPETVGQFTGLKDKNGKDIYEWDILQFNKDNPLPPKIVTFRYGMFYLGNDSLWHYTSKDAYIIIGNKFNDPELLKKGD